MSQSIDRQRLLLTGCIHAVASISVFWLALKVIQSDLGPDPIKTLLLTTGEWGLWCLIASLMVSPLRSSFGAYQLTVTRRPLGLWAFAFFSLHVLIFLQGYVVWSQSLLIEELVERPYITVGFLAWLLLLPLAITSTANWRRRLGRRWKSLHTLVYPAATFACLHILWQIRSDWFLASFYSAVCGLLLGSRLFLYLRRRANRVAE